MKDPLIKWLERNYTFNLRWSQLHLISPCNTLTLHSARLHLLSGFSATLLLVSHTHVTHRSWISHTHTYCYHLYIVADHRLNLLLDLCSCSRHFRGLQKKPCRKWKKVLDTSRKLGEEAAAPLLKIPGGYQAAAKEGEVFLQSGLFQISNIIYSFYFLSTFCSRQHRSSITNEEIVSIFLLCD